MKTPRIGALLIGESPRPDLVRPLARLLPNVELIQAGALDGLIVNEVPDASAAAYPLTTVLEEQRVFVPEDFLAPRLQAALERLEAQGVSASILLCAGTFSSLHGSLPLVKPFDAGRSVLRSLGMTDIGLIAPFKMQEAPIRARWEKEGFHTTVWSADIEKQDKAFLEQLEIQTRENHLQGIVLDYVGHRSEAVGMLQRSSAVPIFDLGDLAIRIIAEMVSL